MAVNLTALSTVTTTATGLNNLVLVTPQSVGRTSGGYQPQNTFITNQTVPQEFQNPALLFHYEGEQTVTLEADITDHYIEDNTAIQDQIALKPAIITTHGFIGELNDVAPVGNQLLKTLQDKLTVLSSYTPQLTIVALNAYNDAFQAYQIAANAAQAAVSAWATINNVGENVIGNQGLLADTSTTLSKFTQNRQQLAFQQFYAYMQERTFFTVQTPWALFQNMSILRLRAVQDETTQVITDFEVTFKQIRLASSIDITNQTNVITQGRLINQSAPLVQGGTSSIIQAPQVNLNDSITSIT